PQLPLAGVDRAVRDVPRDRRRARRVMKVTFVVPRYGVEVRGGAEHAARQLAEHLVADLGWDAEAITTCAVDSRTWADELPARMAMVNGVIVHRFPSEHGRDKHFDRASSLVLASP